MMPVPATRRDAGTSEDSTQRTRISSARAVASAMGVSTAITLPVLLLGGLAVLMRQELGFGPAVLGVAVATFFVGGACIAIPAGHLAERLGPARAATVGLLCTAASSLSVALAPSREVVVLGMLVAGIGNTTAQLGANVLLVRAVPTQLHGTAFGLGQAAFPMAAVLAGISVPALGLTIGWRWSFLFASVIALLAAAALPRIPKISDTYPRLAESTGGLVALAVGMALASAGAISSTAFLVSSSTERGLAADQAASFLVLGSMLSVFVRIGGGWLADRTRLGPLSLAFVLMAAGVAGYGGLAFAAHPPAIGLFAVLALAGGWGWPGLMLLFVSRARPLAAGRLMGVLYLGATAGGIVGPLAFGLFASGLGYSVPWLMLATSMVAGMTVLAVGARTVLTVRPGSQLTG